VLAATLSHSPELDTKLELLGFGHIADLREDQVDALWTQACPTSDSLASYIPPSIACGRPNGAGV
jgi:hypothetical protein